MADDEDVTPRRSSVGSTGWRGAWALFLGGIGLALLIAFAVAAPDLFCDAGAIRGGETPAACVRSWLGALGPWVAIAAALAAIGPVRQQWSEMRRHTDLQLLQAYNEQIRELLSFKRDVIDVDIILKAIDYRIDNIDKDYSLPLLQFFVRYCLKDSEITVLSGSAFKKIANMNVSRLPLAEEEIFDGITRIFYILGHISMFHISESAKHVAMNYLRDDGEEIHKLTISYLSDRIGNAIRSTSDVQGAIVVELTRVETEIEKIEARINAPSSPADSSPAP